MMDRVQKSFIDYQTVGDTGEDTVNSIAPITDGEVASQETLRRPGENTRVRTEELREMLHELAYYRDFGNLSIADGSVTWNGALDDAGTGVANDLTDIVIQPFLTVAQSVIADPVFLTTGSVGSNQITYEGSVAHTRGWVPYGTDFIFVEHVDAAVGSITVEISYEPTKRLIMTFDAGNAAHTSTAAQAAIQGAIAADSYLNDRIKAVLEGTSGAGDPEIGSWRLEFSGYIAEKHRIAAGVLNTFTTANPLSIGDCVAVWYRYLVEPVAGGDWSQWPSVTNGPKSDDQATTVREGRQESSKIITNGYDDVAASSLFVTSLEPEKIPGAVPICKVAENGDLVFCNNVHIPKAKTSVLTGGGHASRITSDAYGWLAATTVQAALKEIVDDLALQTASNGATRIGVNAESDLPESSSAGTLKAQLVELLGFINDKGHIDVLNTWSLRQLFAGGTATLAPVNVTPQASVPSAPAEGDINILSGSPYKSQVYRNGVWRTFVEGKQSRQILFPLSNAMVGSGSNWVFTGNRWEAAHPGGGEFIYFSLNGIVPFGATITGYEAYIDVGTGSGSPNGVWVKLSKKAETATAYTLIDQEFDNSSSGLQWIGDPAISELMDSANNEYLLLIRTDTAVDGNSDYLYTIKITFDDGDFARVP